MCVCAHACIHAHSEVQPHLILWGPKNYSPQGSSVHGNLQARILACTAMPSSRRSCQPRDQACVSCTGRRALYCQHHLGSPFPLTDMVQILSKSLKFTLIDTELSSGGLHPRTSENQSKCKKQCTDFIQLLAHIFPHFQSNRKMFLPGFSFWLGGSGGF